MKSKSLKIEGTLWMSIGALLCWGARGLGMGTLRKPDLGLAPLLAGILFLFFGFLLAVQPGFQPAEAKGKPSENSGKWIGRKGIYSLAALSAYPLLLESLGFICDTFLFMLVLFKIMRPKKWGSNLLISGITVLASYLLFDLWLHIRFPRGIFHLG